MGFAFALFCCQSVVTPGFFGIGLNPVLTLFIINAKSKLSSGISRFCCLAKRCNDRSRVSSCLLMQSGEIVGRGSVA